jgi:hypothetical protein
MEVTMKIMATPVVISVKKPPGPADPNRVWLDPPPKAAPISAPLLVWSKTIKIKRTQITIWIMDMAKVILIWPPLYFLKFYSTSSAKRLSFFGLSGLSGLFGSCGHLVVSLF